MSPQSLDLSVDVHRRVNPLTGDWVLVSPHRAQRPWQGQQEKVDAARLPVHDPHCHLCPGNLRATGQRNPPYAATYVFDNDFAALQDRPGNTEFSRGNLLRARAEAGRCRVLCYSPAHNETLSDMQPQAIRAVVDAWAHEYQELGAQARVRAVTIFENRGTMMGASSPHPHGQIWANQSIPPELAREGLQQRRYQRRHSGCLLCDYLAIELQEGQRVVASNSHFVTVVPFWATWPFETLVLPRAHATAMDELDGPQRDSLAGMLRELGRRYDALFATTFPYTMGWHQRPTDGQPHKEWHLHAHFYPPLLRSATVRKFMVGYEMLAGAQRDMSAELAAERLRTVEYG